MKARNAMRVIDRILRLLGVMTLTLLPAGTAFSALDAAQLEAAITVPP